MKVSNLIKVWYVIVCVLILISSWLMIFNNEKDTDFIKECAIEIISEIQYKMYIENIDVDDDIIQHYHFINDD